MENHNNILLVEGSDDKHVIDRLRKRHDSMFGKEFTIKNCHGVSNLLDVFPAQCAGSDVEIVGVVVDADGNVGSRWQSLRDRLRRNEKLPPLPASPKRGGFVSRQPPAKLCPRIGIWIMPDNSSGGTIEDFLHGMVKQPNSLLNHAEECIDDIASKQISRFGETDRKKALLHTWLAWQQQPGRPYGTAITNGTLDSKADLALEFIHWLSELFA